MNTKGTIVAITGAGGGLGSAMAKRLAAQGAKLALIDYVQAPMNELKTFLFPEDKLEEKSLKAIPLSFQYA